MARCPPKAEVWGSNPFGRAIGSKNRRLSVAPPMARRERNQPRRAQAIGNQIVNASAIIVTHDAAVFHNFALAKISQSWRRPT
jgi:hypothetical protein